MQRVSTALTITALVVALVSFAPGATSRVEAQSLSAPTASYFLHGTALDQANKAQVLTDPTSRGTATFDTTAPTGTVPIAQTTTPQGVTDNDQDTVGNALAAYWRGPFSGTVAGQLLELKWSWSTGNPTATLLDGVLDVTVFADPDYVADRLQPQHVIGRARVTLPGVNPAPKQFTSLIPITGNVSGELMIQVFGHFVDTNNNMVVSYDSTTTPSSFRFIDTPPVATPSVSFDSTTVAFAPSTVVSAHFLGAEPQVTMERRIAASQPGRIDPKRIFIDWPLSSRSNTGQLSRSTDGGDSFRLLLDLTCAARSRPNCMTGGGGDTENTVNLANGNLFFSDQEVLANIAEASSTDHGDSFPATRQFAVTNAALVTDRHWLAATDGVDVSVAGQRIDAFLAYHGGPVTTVGQYVQGITADGIVLPQPVVGQIRNVSQSGSIRFDGSNGPGRGWIYQAFYNSSGVKVATALGSTYIDPNAWVTNHVDALTPLLFPWLQLDNAGNAYVAWSGSSNGVIYLSMSPINDPRNDPTQGGRPGTFWTPKVRVTPPQIKSSIFAAVVGGDAGRIAVGFTGSEDCVVPNGASYIPDNCALTTTWNTYVSIIPNALSMATGAAPATISTGKVSHRVMHRGTICTGGTVSCLVLDRSLLDMEDIGFDEDGRVGLVFMDNNNRLAAPNLTDANKGAPFTLYAKQVAGPSLVAAKPIVSVPVAEGSVADPAGDATWPNTAAAVNLASADLLGAQAFVDSTGQLVARIPVTDSSVKQIQSDIATFNSRSLTQTQMTRFQYVFRFATDDGIWHMSFEQNADGTGRFFGGRLDANDGLMNLASNAVVGVAYHTDAIAVNGSTRANVITLRAKASDFGLALGSRITQATAFSLAAEPEATELTIANAARTIDATPPFDATLALGAEPAVPIDCTDPSVSSGGGWHVLSDPRAGNGTLCRTVNGQKHGAFMQIGFNGQAIDVIGAKGPRGGTATVSIDGVVQAKISEFRPATNPSNPDNSGRTDLDFGVKWHFTTSNGPHTLRIDVLNDSGVATQNMFYVDGFAVTAGDTTPPPAGSTTDVAKTLTGTALPLANAVTSLLTDALTTAITVVVESTPGATVTITSPTGQVLATATVGGDGVVEVAIPITAIGQYGISIGDTTEAAFTAWEILTEGR